MSLYERYPALQVCKEEIERAAAMWIRAFEAGGKLLCCGNGGSCADCDHIVGELMKGFLLKREPGEEFERKLEVCGFPDARELTAHLQGALPAISLTSQTALLSAFANDVSADTVYAQMVYGYGRKEDVLLCISTSGNSENAVCAAKVAKAMGLSTVCLTGAAESRLSRICDVAIRVPETETYKVQELHLPVYHHLCAEVEAHFFGEAKGQRAYV